MLRILDPAAPAESAEWLDLWNRWPAAEVFSHPAYLALYANSTTAPRCAIFEKDGVHILYPFLVRDLVSEGLTEGISHAYDMTSAYGYGGPFVWGDGDRAEAAALFWREFAAWTAGRNVVSEFVRFSLFRENLLPYPGATEWRSRNVIRTLDLDPAGLWMDFEHKVRKNVIKAQRSGVTIEWDGEGRRMEDFLRIYYATMKRREAPARYYFPPSYFQKLTRNLAGHIAYFHAIQNDAVIASELILISSENIYSFLGGTDERYFDLRPNDLLKYEVILWAKGAGKRRYVLGGGYQGEDGIYRYKRSFAPTGISPFFIGKRILRRDLYHHLIACRKRQSTRAGLHWNPAPAHFPQYRCE